MDNSNGAAADNWRIHFTRVPATPVKSSPTLDKKYKHSRLSVSLDDITVRQVRDLAFKERTSDSAVIEAALRGFFDSGNSLNLHAILARLGIAPRRRKALDPASRPV
jgi:hypothetical protein